MRRDGAKPAKTQRKARAAAEKLLEEAKRLHEASDPLSTRRVKQARRTAMKARTRLGRDQPLCRKCNAYLDSTNSTTRIRDKVKIVRCNSCGNVRRKPVG